MLIDYIYLVLIIGIICFILFLIYLSYEYRIEEFALQSINLSNNDNNIIKNLQTSLLNKYNHFYVDNYNEEIEKINNTNLNLYNTNLLNIQLSDDLKKRQLSLIKEKHGYPVDKPIKTIKSKYNSQNISIFNNDIDKYGILANDKCLTVNGLCNGEFCLLNCQSKLLNTSNSQKFTTSRINSSTDAAKVMNVEISKINTSNIYPFNIFQSTINNRCLTISDGGITVEKCNLNNKKQQWEISPDENICYLS